MNLLLIVSRMQEQEVVFKKMDFLILTVHLQE